MLCNIFRLLGGFFRDKINFNASVAIEALKDNMRAGIFKMQLQLLQNVMKNFLKRRPPIRRIETTIR